MASPTWTKSGVATVTFAQGRFFPYLASRQEGNQIVGETDDRTVVVADLGGDVEFIEGVLERVPASVIDAMHTFLKNSQVRWSKNTFTWTDEASTTHVVRFWEPIPLPKVRVGDDLYNSRFLLRVE